MDEVRLEDRAQDELRAARIRNVRIRRGNGVLLDDAVGVQVGVDDVEATVVLVVGVERHAQEPRRTVGRDLRTDVEEGIREQRPVLHDADAARPVLDDEQTLEVSDGCVDENRTADGRDQLGSDLCLDGRSSEGEREKSQSGAVH